MIRESKGRTLGLIGVSPRDQIQLGPKVMNECYSIPLSADRGSTALVPTGGYKGCWTSTVSLDPCSFYYRHPHVGSSGGPEPYTNRLKVLQAQMLPLVVVVIAPR